MNAAILCIGTELTRGERGNGNAQWLGERLTEFGFEVTEHAVVADDPARIVAALARLGREARVLLVTGGLGPTSDDLTSSAAAQALGVPLVRDPGSMAAIEARYLGAGRVMPEPNRKQADFPAGALVLPNAAGTAPGFAVDLGSARAFFLPGVPSEMTQMFDTHVLPAIAGLAARTSHQIHIRTVGLPESAVAERLRDIDLGGARHRAGVLIGYRASVAEVEVKVLARAVDEASARELAQGVAAEARERLHDVAYGGKEASFSAYVAEQLRRAGLRVALAESCTGGLIGKLLSDVAGSSEYLWGGAVSYSNAAKRRLLGVSADLLRGHGAVSEPVAAAMAEGVLRLSEVDLAVAVTGIAGPAGGSEEKPVGTVCFALARQGRPTRAWTERFGGDRERVRLRTAYAALRALSREALETMDARAGERVDETRA